jgi:hypothetical protein
MLAHKYEVKGVKEWLLEHGITVDSVCAAASFACESVQDVCDGLLEACRKHASWSLPKVSEGALAGVPARAARELLRAHTENLHLGRVCDVAEGFKYVQRWVRTNEGSGMFTSAKKGAESLVEMLELSRLPHSFLCEHVRESGLVSKKRLWQILDETLKAEKQARLANKSARLRFVGELSYYMDYGEQFHSINSLTTCGTGANARLAVVDCGHCCVYVFSLEEMKCLWKVGREGTGPGEFMRPRDAVFDGRGHLWVSDLTLKTIQRFDGQGNFVACIEATLLNAGEFSSPCGMALSAQGDVVVCDKDNECVAVFDPDGKFLRVVPAAHDQHNTKLNAPFGILPAADGNIIVLDFDCVRLFSVDGLFVKEIKPPELGSDEHWSPYCMCSGTGGELISVEDDERGRLCMRDADYDLVWCVEDPEKKYWGIRMDYTGRLFCQSSNHIRIFEVEFE